MRRKLYSILLFLFVVSIFPVTSVHANSGPPVIGITVMPDVCDVKEDNYEEYIFPGNIDILVRLEDFPSEDFGQMTDKYKEFYPFYEDVEYLDNLPTGWTSFSAYYQDDDEWGYSSYELWCGMQFGDHEIVSNIQYIKVVYFDDDGMTLSISESLEVPEVYFYQDRDSIIYLNTTTYELEPDMDPVFDPYFIIGVFMILLLILYSVILEVIMAIIFKLRTKKQLLHILLINIITQTIMYVYFLVLFDNYNGNFQLQLLIYEFLVLVVEFFYLQWRFKGTITPKRLMLYVFISNVVSYLTGFLLNFY